MGVWVSESINGHEDISINGNIGIIEAINGNVVV